MSEHSLQNKYISVSKDGTVSYGGNQSWSENSIIRRCGCGVVSSLDLLLYLDKYHCGGEKLAAGAWPLPFKEYDRLCTSLSRRYLPLLPPLGINGVSLALGLNGFFLKHNMPFRASWRVSCEKLMGRVEAMLDDDIPVILSIGTNFPFVWQKNRVTLYTGRTPGEMRKAASTKAHYVTVTGCDDKRLRISSWGKEYYIDKAEYLSYIKQHSSSVISNVMLIERH